MEEAEQKQLLGRVLSVLAIVLMTSGILVKTVPLESKRPADPEHAKFSYAGLQDVEARLWQDPFGAIRHLQGSTPSARCGEALKDEVHHPYGLSERLKFFSGRSGDITILPILVPGGVYFENGEWRRRARYAVVTALLEAGWVPSDEDKLGYVWTFENCVEKHWARQIPELLPYEWFKESPPRQSSRQSDAGTPRQLLVLWLDEDSMSRRPLSGIEQLGEMLGKPHTLCSPPPQDEKKGAPWLARARQDLATKLYKEGACYKSSTHEVRGRIAHWQANEWPVFAAHRLSISSQTFQVLLKNDESNSDSFEPTRATPCPNSYREVPWCHMRVIGPSTSTPLQGMVDELASRLVHERASAQPHRDPWPTRFYSATATVELGPPEFSRAIKRAKERTKRREDAPKSSEIIQATPDESEDLNLAVLQQRFDNRMVRLTMTDEKLAKAFVNELVLRLGDPTPWQRLVARWKGRQLLCDDIIVIVGEYDTPYARDFRQAFANALQERCGRDDTVMQVGYLRGLDGVLPTGTGTSAPPAPQQTASDGTDTRLQPIGNILPDQGTRERADGHSQYDYLRRLGNHLIDLDHRKRQKGDRGVTAIGVLGNDTYDKLLVLDALREYFPRAVFFAADLDARLLGREALRSTRNLVVASAYGLKLHPKLQGTAPPFRDTYQTGIYLATRVAMDPDAQHLPTSAFEKWFTEPRLFEIGRTRAVALSRTGTESDESCEWPRPQRCGIIHPDDEWHGFDPLPNRGAAVAMAVMVLTATMLGLLLSDRAYAAVQGAMAWLNKKPSRWGVLVLTLGLFVAGLWVIKNNVETAAGEPFAWLEGVSIWPTQILQMLLLILTGALLVGGRMWLHHKVDKVASQLHVQTLTDREKTHSSKPSSNIRTRVMQLWGLGRRPQAEKDEDESATDPWSEFLDCMRRKPSTTRVVCITVLFFLFSLALLSLDWPNSPHRGALSAWSNHVLQLVLLAGMTAVLVSALDASRWATCLLRACLDQYGDVTRRSELVRQAHTQKDPVVDNMQGAAEITSAVNLLIYLPFLIFLLIVPARSRVFDAWVFPLPYVILILLAIGVALLHMIFLRRAIADRRTQILADIDQQVKRYALQTKLGQEGDQDAKDVGPELPASAKADLLNSYADRLRSMHDGPFRPLLQEPAVRALLIVLGGTGTLTIVEFLFLGHG